MHTRRKSYTRKTTQQDNLIQKEKASKLQKHVKQTQKSKNGNADNNLTDNLKRLYTDLKSVPNYSAKIQSFLRQYDLHSRNRRIVKKVFPRRRIITRFPNHVWQADLIEYQDLKYYNKGFKYILLVIDVFSKKIYVEPVKRKMGSLVSEAIDKVISRSDAAPVMLVTDAGKEFFNSKFEQVMINNNINHFKTPTKTPWKASVVERANRTIKTKISRWMQHTDSKSWINALEDIVKSYNQTPHSSHGLAPNSVTDKNSSEVYRKLYPYRKVKVDCRLQIGDIVRTIRKKTEFEKGYTPKWSEELFKIKTVRQSNSVCWYELANSTGQKVPGIWYFFQLNLVARES